jgi:hypothetical protein
VKINPNRPWTGDEVATLKRMLAEGADFPAIGRILKRTETGVASQVFSLKALDAECDASRICFTAIRTVKRQSL